MLRFAIPCLLLLAGGCTMTAEQSARADAVKARDEAKLDHRLAGLSALPPVNCLDQRDANVTVYGNKLLYGDNGRYWLNQPTDGCFSSHNSDDIIVSKSYGPRLCSGDIIHTVSRAGGFQSGACSLGEFVPYRKPRS